MEIKFGNRTIGVNRATYFIADIAANHDGDLERAKLLIRSRHCYLYHYPLNF